MELVHVSGQLVADGCYAAAERVIRDHGPQRDERSIRDGANCILIVVEHALSRHVSCLSQSELLLMMAQTPRSKKIVPNTHLPEKCPTSRAYMQYARRIWHTLLAGGKNVGRDEQRMGWSPGVAAPQRRDEGFPGPVRLPSLD